MPTALSTPASTYIDHDHDQSVPGSCGASAPDSAYALTLTFPHTGNTDTIVFTAPNASGLNGFALADVSVQVARPTVAIATADVEADAVNGELLLKSSNHRLLIITP